MPFLEKEFPHLVDEYRQRFGERSFVSKAYAKRLSELMAALRKKYGIKKEVMDRKTVSSQYRVQDLQMEMFG